MGLFELSDIMFTSDKTAFRLRICLDLSELLNKHLDDTILTLHSAGNVYRSTSFYVQKLFSQNRGDQYLPSTLPSQNGTLFWSVVRKTSTNQVIIKASLFHRYYLLSLVKNAFLPRCPILPLVPLDLHLICRLTTSQRVGRRRF
jgi:hypothetical protein